MSYEALITILKMIGIAIIGGVAAVGLWMLVIVAFKQISVAFEPRPKKLVRKFFHQHHPTKSISWLTLAGDEPSRWVVGVFYGKLRPPHFMFFTVDRVTEEIVELEDCSQYSPKLWR